MSAVSLRPSPSMLVLRSSPSPVSVPAESERTTSPQNSALPGRPQLPEPLLQRMASYELERAVAYALVPDLARMQHRLESACADLAQIDGSAPRIEAARHEVIKALYQRALDAVDAGQVEQMQALWSRVEMLGGQCTQPPEWLREAGVHLLDDAHAAAAERAAKDASYSAEFGDACRLRLELDAAARHPGAWAMGEAERAFLVAVCARRLANPDTSLLARMPSAAFVQAQVDAMKALAAEVGQPYPDEISALVEVLEPQHDGSDSSIDLWDDEVEGQLKQASLPQICPQPTS